MKIALTENFLEDFADLQPNLQHKCQEMLSVLRKIETKNLKDQAVPGWRLHKLQSSPFVSFSIDMNFRALAKIDGDIVYFHRVVKHSLADSPKINRNDSSDAPFLVTDFDIKPFDVYGALISTGIDAKMIEVFKDVKTEDDFLNALSVSDDVIANYALTFYETSSIPIARTRYQLLHDDKEFDAVLRKDQQEWEVYLHPSQTFIVELPLDYRLAVSGSAGTGKTVCAWYRMQYLARHNCSVGFVAPNNAVLEISRKKLDILLKDSFVECYYLVPSSENHLIQLANSVSHLIIDEGQELAPSWYRNLGQHYKEKGSGGITIFYDLNQLGGNIQSGDNRRFDYRLSEWDSGINEIPLLNRLDLYINYRNSREIAMFYTRMLEHNLPFPVKYEIPVFSTGEVVTHTLADLSQLGLMVAETAKKLHKDYLYEEIAVVIAGGISNLDAIYHALNVSGIPTTSKVEEDKKLLLTKSRIIRGHERKAIICIMPVLPENSDAGKVINAYVALSRARDRLIIIQIKG